ncbi:MAG: ABC transporter permease [Acetivibrionales bacterium]
MKKIERLFKSKTLYGVIIVLILWHAMHITLRSRIIPGPLETIEVFLSLLCGDLPVHIAVSLYRIILAMVISVVIGVPLGLWVGLNKKADAVISPIAYILYPIPKIAFLPVFMLLFGIGNKPKIILILTIIIFQILLASRDGVKEISRVMFYSVASLGLNRRQIYLYLVFPAALPKIISALRTSIGISISALFFAENFATTYGIGYFIMNSWIMVDYVRMFAGILALSIMGILIFKIIDFSEKKLCPWMFIHEPDC